MNIKQLLLTALLTLASNSAMSASLAISNLSGGSQIAGSTHSLGWQFSISQTITVTELGLFDSGSNGLVDAHTIGIFNNVGGAALMTASVNSSTNNLVSGFQFASVIGGPQVLNAGTYRIAADQASSTSDLFFFLTSATFNPNVSYLQGVHCGSCGALTFPSTLSNNNHSKYIGPNFQFNLGDTTTSSVPEPASIMLLGLGAIGLIASRRKASV